LVGYSATTTPSGLVADRRLTLWLMSLLYLLVLLCQVLKMKIMKHVRKINVKAQVFGDLMLARLSSNFDIFLEAGTSVMWQLMHFFLRGVGCY
jgi:hypothetical protein